MGLAKGEGEGEGRSCEKTAGKGNHLKRCGLGNFIPTASVSLHVEGGKHLHLRERSRPGSAGCAKPLCHSYTETVGLTEPLSGALPPSEIPFSPTAGPRATSGAEICAAGTEIPSWHFAVPEINLSLGFICSWLMPQKSSQERALLCCGLDQGELGAKDS